MGDRAVMLCVHVRACVHDIVVTFVSVTFGLTLD